jgi:hypothetical protein
MNERRLGETILQGARRATRLRISILNVAVGIATRTTEERGGAWPEGKPFFYFCE